MDYPVLKRRQLRHALVALKSVIGEGDAADTKQTQEELRRALFSEILPACFEHSDASGLAAMDAAFDLKLGKEASFAAMRPVYDKLSAVRKGSCVQALPAHCESWGVALPPWLLTAGQAECQDALRRALAERNVAALQAVCSRVKVEPGASEVCGDEYRQALQKLREEHRIPDGWDIDAMLGGDRRLLAKTPLHDVAALLAADALLKQTIHAVRTRDRKGRVPASFEAVSAVQVMNAANWRSYHQRRQDIEDECRRVGARTDERYWREALNGPLMTTPAALAFVRLTNAPGLQQGANEVWMLHVTSQVASEAITSDDFDMARSSPLGLFGAGLYFAESINKSDEYVQATDEGLFPLLLCRVTLGNVFYCDERFPDRQMLQDRCLRQNWHSVLGDRKKLHGTFREFIVYDNLQVFPAYIIYYKRLY